MADTHSVSGTPPQKTPELGRARHYVNRIDLSISLSEVCIDFGQVFPGEAAPRAQCLLVTSPSHLRSFGRSIASVVETYEERFGTLIGGLEPLSVEGARSRG